MADASITPPPPSTFGGMNQSPASMMNAVRVTAVVDRLATFLKAEADSSPSQFASPNYSDLLVSLARGIDYSISRNEMPPAPEKLPKLLNEIRHRKMDACSQGYVMVLMISVKNACKAGWFSEKESQDLMSFADEIGSCFCKLRDINVGSSEGLSAISTIFARFYPQLKMGQILGSLEVQPGYGAFMVDFQILKSASHSPEKKIMLLAAQVDNVETSACIVTPQQVNILLNGIGVEKRTNIYMDPGPQMPTHVTKMVKFGANILQAVGQFCGHYVIAIAFMSMSSQTESTVLKDYVPPVASASYSDSDLIEGQSRISLNCPISRTRIQVPVKGQSCKHLQCFDYSNYVDINSRHPSWRCPHCSSHLCFTDLRIDQNIAKVLKEVGGDFSDVMISADGSWKTVMETDNEVAPSTSQVAPQGQKSVVGSDPVPQICDLTGHADEMNANENEDTKPLQRLKNQTMGVSFPSELNNINSTFGTQSVARTPVAVQTLQSNFQTPGVGPMQAVNSTFENAQLNVSRTPVTLQTLQPMLRWSSMNPSIHGGGSSMSSPATVSWSPHVTSSQGSTRPPYPFQYSTTMQVLSPLPQHFKQTTTAQPFPVQFWSPVQNPGPPRTSPGLIAQFQHAQLQIALNQLASASAPRIQPPPNIPQTQLPRAQSPMGPLPGPNMTHTAQGLAQAARVGSPVSPVFRPATPSPGEHRGNTFPQPSSGSEASGENWQPVSHMRGSITGRAYTDVISRLMIQPTRPAQPGGPPPPQVLPNPVPNLHTPPHLRR